MLQNRAGLRNGRSRLKAKPLQQLVDMPERIDPSDRLLTQVAPLDEIDGAVVATKLLRQVFVGNLLAEHRRARFDAQNIETAGVDLDQAKIPAVLEQALFNRHRRSQLADHGQAPRQRRRLAYQAHGLPPDLGCDMSVFRLFGQPAGDAP